VYFRLVRPNSKALAILKTRPGRYWINYIEEALDFIFESKGELETATNTVNRHHYKKYRRKQQVTYKKKTRYSGPRKANNNFVTYPDKPCRQTGEQNCLHVETRLRRYALEKAKLITWDDIIALDRHEFWEQQLTFKAVDHEKLGNLFNKRQSDKRDRKGNAKLGNAIMAQLKEVQCLVDRYKGDVRINDCLITLDVCHLISMIDGSVDMGTPFGEECEQVQVVVGEMVSTSIVITQGAPVARRDNQSNRSKQRFRDDAYGPDTG
jgi:hypothetical protein